MILITGYSTIFKARESRWIGNKCLSLSTRLMKLSSFRQEKVKSVFSFFFWIVGQIFFARNNAVHLRKCYEYALFILVYSRKERMLLNGWSTPKD